jgi:hypothetical protein
MATSGGPDIKRDGLVFAIDSDSNIRGFTKYGTSGTNNNHRAIRNLVDRSSTFSTANTSQLTGGVTYYTLYGITYPEGNYSPANRDGVTPGFENTTAAMTYAASRDLNYYVFDENTNTWVPDSYFNGERISGHCYDTYDGEPSQHATFQADYDNIKNAFPNATHIVIGSHASENVDNDANTVTRLKEIGFPDDAVGLGRVEFVLAGKVNKPWTHHYVRENVSSAVANMVIGLPLEGKGGALTFDGTDDHITDTLPISGNGAPHTIEMIFSSNVNQGSLGGRRDPFTIGNSSIHQYSALDVNTSNMNWYFYGKDTSFTNSPQMVANQYYHIVLSYAGGFSNNTNKKVWINGVQQSLSAGVNETSQLPDNPSFSIGRDRGRNTAYWPGKIPVFKVYDRALSQEEAQQNYNAYKNRFNL